MYDYSPYWESIVDNINTGTVDIVVNRIFNEAAREIAGHWFYWDWRSWTGTQWIFSELEKYQKIQHSVCPSREELEKRKLRKILKKHPSVYIDI